VIAQILNQLAETDDEKAEYQRNWPLECSHALGSILALNFSNNKILYTIIQVERWVFGRQVGCFR
jgi:hypothetical protein